MIARERNGARKKGNEEGRIKGDWRRKRRVSRGSRCKRGGKVDADKMRGTKDPLRGSYELFSSIPAPVRAL